MVSVQKAFHNGEDYENCYLFSPSISKRKTVGKQTYYVRRYFHGGRDFERAMEQLATKQINTIIVKDLSRFGRNYIEVGQYVDYVFPAFGIRFIAIQDNVDTENRDSGAMEMMPIMNVFNEWHAANTSKKIRAVKRSNAIAGVYSARE